MAVPVVGWIVSALMKVAAPFLAGLKAMLALSAAMFVAKALIGLGLYFLVLQPATDWVITIMSQGFAGLPGVLAAWFGFLNINKFFSLMVSAYAASFVGRIILSRTPAGA